MNEVRGQQSIPARVQASACAHLFAKGPIMQHPSSGNAGMRKRACVIAVAILFAPFPTLAGALDAQDASAIAAHSSTRVYSVINMGPEAGMAALLNERGQAAYGSFRFSGMSNSFFDGDRVRNIASLGGSYTLVRALSNNGVVVGESEDAEEHSNTVDLTDPNVDFPVAGCTEEGAEDIIRIRFRSAHKNRCNYHTYIQFDSTQVIAWYCTCPGGPRVVGCCSHIASAIWFLGYERYQTTTTRKPSTTNTTNIHYADDISDFEPSSDDEENDSLYTLN